MEDFDFDSSEKRFFIIWLLLVALITVVLIVIFSLVISHPEAIGSFFGHIVDGFKKVVK
jgi:hypothetical protein